MTKLVELRSRGSREVGAGVVASFSFSVMSKLMAAISSMDRSLLNWLNDSVYK